MYGGSPIIIGAGYTGGSTAAVFISGSTFSPASVALPVSAGVTVTWTNNDGVARHDGDRCGPVGARIEFSLLPPGNVTGL